MNNFYSLQIHIFYNTVEIQSNRLQLIATLKYVKRFSYFFFNIKNDYELRLSKLLALVFVLNLMHSD